MNLLKRTISKVWHSSSKKVKAAVSVITVTAVLTGVVSAGYSPSGRPVLDWNKPADRKGSLNGPRINAFINTPSYGDERAFFDARNPGETTSKDVLHNVDQSDEVILRTFIHNGANQDFNEDGRSIAKDAKVRIDLPTGSSEALRSRSYISISNPAPGYPAEVTDTAELVGAKDFSIKYVPGSAKLMNNVHTGAGIALNDSIVTTGAPVGYDNLNGNLPGCFEFAAFVEIRVKIQVPETDIQKQVREAGTTEYGELAEVKPGETVQWLIKQEQKGSAKQEDVQVFDALPAHLEVVPDSVKWIYRGVNGNDEVIKMSDTNLFTKLVDFGSWQPNTFFYIRFDTVALDDFDKCEILLTNQARSKTKQNPNEQRDNAQVKITKENCNPEPPVKNPKFACDLLTLKTLGDRKIKLTAKASASNGAVVKRYIYNFGDGSQPLTTDKNMVEYQYKKDGTFNSSVQVVVDVNGEEKIITGNACVASVTFKPNQPPVVPETPEAPTALPNTGPGDVVVAFLAVTIGSSVAYYVVVRRFAGV